MKVLACLLAAVCLWSGAEAQNIEAILEFAGAGLPEDMDPYEMERYESMLIRPLEINQLSSSKLEASGLFTPYQLASLADYRARHGDIYSLNELSSIDGFGSVFVSRLAPFISLETIRLPGDRTVSGSLHDLSVRAGVRKGFPLTYGMKYRLSVGERISGGVSFSRTSSADDNLPDACSGYIAYHLKKRHGKLVIGDFNARFGQGLSLWNGMSMGGLASVSSFMRKPSGISPSSSFTGGYSLRGIAGDIILGHLKLSAMTAIGKDRAGFSVLPALNLSYLFSKGQLSLLHYADFLTDGSMKGIADMKTAFDFELCLSGTDFYGELSYDWVSSSAAFLSGVSFAVGKSARMAAMLRYYPDSFVPYRSAAARSTSKCSNEYAFSSAMEWSAGKWIRINGMSGFGSSAKRYVSKMSADFAYFPVPKDDNSIRSLQLKALYEASVMISSSLKVTVRLSERVRTWGQPFRTDFRTDFSYMSGRFYGTLRLNLLRCMETGLLSYAEGGYRSGKLALYLRQGIFRIDRWDDRIYVYERDAPGAFNVPAYYGRGIWSAVTMNWRFVRWGRMYFRAAWTSYPFMAIKKPGRAELKMQFTFTF